MGPTPRVHLERSLDGRLFVPTPVVSPSGHARDFEETRAWVEPKLRRVPITRVGDITPLDYLGLPVWLAITPLAKDLTTHSGKGRNPAAARLSAVMEAIERSSAEAVEPERVLNATRSELAEREPHGFRPVDPTEFNLPFDTQFGVDRPCGWILSFDLIQRTHFWVPVDLVLSPPRDGVCTCVETNGLASGNTLTEAAVHALYEIFERYSATKAEYGDLFAEPSDPAFRASCMIDTRTLPADSLEWVSRIESLGITLTVRDESCELGVPVFRVRMYDPQVPLPGLEGVPFDGFGADLSASRALFRAVAEAVQVHTGSIRGGRDTEGLGREHPGRSHSLRRLVEMKQPLDVEAFAAADDSSRDLCDDLSSLVARLAAGGHRHCLTVDLTRTDLDVPVVRVLVSDMVQLHTGRRPSSRCLATLV